MTNFILIMLLFLILIRWICLFIFSKRDTKRFCYQAVALLKNLNETHHALFQAFLASDESPAWFPLIQDFQKNYPSSVDAPYFNPRLKPGFQFFLRRLDQLHMFILSLSSLQDFALKEKLIPLIKNCAHQNSYLFVLIQQALQAGVFDFNQNENNNINQIDDIILLEQALSKEGELSIEREIALDKIKISQGVRLMRDIREVLLILLWAIPLKKMEI